MLNRPRISPLLLVLLLLPLLAPNVALAASLGIWISPDEIRRLPMDGPAWRALQDASRASTRSPQISDQNDPTNVAVLAKALVAVRTDDSVLRNEVVQACRDVMGTEAGSRSLAIGRELIAYVIAADLVGLPADLDATFRSWLREMQTRDFQGRTLISTHEDRANNWGTHAGASRIAVALYLGDRGDLERAARVFHGYLGNRGEYAGFKYGELGWQADASRPVGINPLGASRDGHSIDGVLPDDQRRSGGFRWPAPRENYVWEGLQGAIAQAVLLHRAGFDVWNWEDRALLRAVQWLHEQVDYPADGDDTWQPHIVNYYYGSTFPAEVPSRPGKNVGFTDWTHQRASGLLAAPYLLPD